MNRMLTTTGFLSAATLVGLAGITQGQADATSSPDTPSPDAPMNCCVGGGMMGMMGGGDSATTRPVERVDLNAQQQAAVDDLTVAYLSVQKSLVNDSADGVAGDFEKVHEAAHALAEADNAKLKAAAEKVSDAAHADPKTLDAAREAFKPLSEAIIALVRMAPPSDDAAKGLHVAHCPMAKASWLQTSKEVANPYMGQSMPKCGTIRSTLKGGQEQ